MATPAELSCEFVEEIQSELERREQVVDRISLMTKTFGMGIPTELSKYNFHAKYDLSREDRIIQMIRSAHRSLVKKSQQTGRKCLDFILYNTRRPRKNSIIWDLGEYIQPDQDDSASPSISQTRRFTSSYIDEPSN